MKLIYTLFLTFFVVSAYAQDSTSVNRPDTIYVVPSSSSANLSMIVPPEGFVVSKEFNGYIHYQMATAIIMTYIEGTNYLNIEKGMTDAFYKENKLNFISKKKIVTDNGTKGLSYKFSFVLDTVEFSRYMIYAGDLNNTLWLSITSPMMADELMSSEINKVIQSIQLTPRKDEE